jgi:ABC-type cobalamin/Fe3+-siderophores transport system ATPase subunit
MNALLETRDICFSYGAHEVLRDISLSVWSGEVTGILGPNGAGKSTLLRLLVGLLSPCRGDVLVGGHPLATLSCRERACRIAFVPQEAHFPFSFSSLEVVLMGRTAHLPPFSFESAADVDIAREALATTDCAHLAGRSILSLSGGERRRVVLARALAQDPALLLLDEPTSFLDLKHAIHCAALLRRLAHAKGLGVIAVMHDVSLAAACCDRICLLQEGSLVAEGRPSEVLTSDRLSQLFGMRVGVGHDATSGIPYCIPLDPLALGRPGCGERSTPVRSAPFSKNDLYTP